MLAPLLSPKAPRHLTEPFADPVPQSLVLTAIVIGFGVLAFSLVLAHRVHMRQAPMISMRSGVASEAFSSFQSRCQCSRRLYCSSPRARRFCSAGFLLWFDCVARRDRSVPASGAKRNPGIASGRLARSLWYHTGCRPVRGDARLAAGLVGIAVTATSFAGVDPVAKLPAITD